MTLPAEKVGDKGQRYEVAAKRSGIVSAFGWAEDLEAAKRLADAACLHPSITKAFVIDRREADTAKMLVYHTEKKGR